MKKVLVIQTAFIGDVILATSFIESVVKNLGSDSTIDVLVRKGNEVLLKTHPLVNQVHIWDKKNKKYKNLLAISRKIRAEKYDVVFNLQRFASTGFVTWRSKAGSTLGFKTNPFSLFFQQRIAHQIGDGTHEVERNVALLTAYLKKEVHPEPMSLHPSKEDWQKVEPFSAKKEYLVMAPASVWFTKQLPFEKWIELIKKNADHHIYLIGAPGDAGFIQEIIEKSKVNTCENLAGKLSLMESAALIKNAKRSFVNDSAPLHMASAMNAPVTAFFCSTVPSFGFGPLSEEAKIRQITENLACRPCGLHGYKKCPKGHFKCGYEINLD